MTVVDPAAVRRIADMHAVYRMFDEAGRLLYIGVSGRAGRRFDQHSEKRWFPLVGLITLEWHATKAAAELAERRAIAAERPRYNVTGSPIAVRPVRAVKLEPVGPDILGDVLEIFGDAAGLYWEVIAARLAEHSPRLWAGVSKSVVSAQCRELGVPSVAVNVAGNYQRGCRRRDVEQALARHVLTEAG